MPTYKTDATGPPDFPPFDLDEVVDLTWDWSDIMAVDTDTIVQSTWTPGTGITVGDGVTVVASEAGNVTPVAPTIIASSTKTLVWVSFTAPGRWLLENSVRTTNGRVYSRSAYVIAQDK